MSNQPKLFDVPKDRPRRKQRLAAFKASNGIQTHFCADYRSGGNAWMAIHMPTATKALEGYGVKPDVSLMELMAGYCRLLDEGGMIFEANTEAEAIRKCCVAAEIPCDL